MSVFTSCSYYCYIDFVPGLVASWDYPSSMGPAGQDAPGGRTKVAGAKSRYGRPASISGDSPRVVRFDDGRETRLGYLRRPDLLKVSGHVARSLGERSGGLKWTNDQHVEYICSKAPWTGSGEEYPHPRWAPRPPRSPKGEEDAEGRIPTVIKCACGHSFRYRIRKHRYESTRKWLEGRPCPPCAKRKGGPSPRVPPGTPEPEVEDQEDQHEDSPKQEDKVEDNPLDLRLETDLELPLLPEPHHERLPTVVRWLMKDVPVWMQGPPGTSKSTMAAQAAEALGLELRDMGSCHKLMTRSDLFGYQDARGVFHETPFSRGFRDGGLLMIDEIDNGNSNVLAALNTALSNGRATFAGETVHKHPDFRVIAAANTAGMGPESGFLGREGVDQATLDRFVTVFVPVDEALESFLVEAIAPEVATTLLKCVRAIRREVESRKLRIVVSPRAVLDGARGMTAGFTLGEVLEMKVTRGLDQVTKQALLEVARNA